jgi:tripartite-type tricarboxylate transporter receptor subunit TctC
MTKFLIAFLFFVMPITSFARETIEVVSRFDAHITTAMLARELLSEVQRNNNKYEFRFTVVPGASGENADLRAIALSRAGQKVLVAGSASTWSRNSYVFPNTFNRNEDIIPIIGYGGTPFAIQVAPNSNINSLNDLLEYIRNKPEAFHATTTANSSSKFFALIFEKKFNLNNVKQLSYRRSSDLIRAILNKEADFAIYNIVDSQGALKFITISTKERLQEHLNVLTGIESGFPEFNFTTLSTISTTKENIELIRELGPYFKRACVSDSLSRVFEKFKINRYCYDRNQVKNVIDTELILLEEYKEFIN